MGVNVRRSLLVGVAHDLRGDQRGDAGLVEQRHVVMAESDILLKSLALDKWVLVC